MFNSFATLAALLVGRVCSSLHAAVRRLRKLRHLEHQHHHLDAAKRQSCGDW